MLLNAATIKAARIFRCLSNNLSKCKEVQGGAGSIINLEEGGASDTQITGTHVPPAAAAYCEAGSSDEEIGGDDGDEVTNATWVPDRTEESSEEEEEAQQTRGTTSSLSNRSQSKASDVRAAQVQSAVVSKHTYRNSAVWEFFKKCAADRTIATCNLCQMRIKRGKNIPRLGTTCLRRHMTTCHASRWHNTLHRSSSSSSVSTPTIYSIPSSEDLRSQITLPQLLHQSKVSEVTAAQVQSAVVSKHMYRMSAVWEFFKKCAADRTVAICNLCQMRIKCGKDIPRLGTTCLRRHMTTCHASRWHNTLHRSSSSSSVSTPTICPAMSLPTTSTDRDNATVMGVPGPSSECDSIPSPEDLRSLITNENPGDITEGPWSLWQRSQEIDKRYQVSGFVKTGMQSANSTSMWKSRVEGGNPLYAGLIREDKGQVWIQGQNVIIRKVHCSYKSLGICRGHIGDDDDNDDEVTDSTWVPDRTEESSEEEEAQQTRGTTSSMTNRSTSQSKASDVRAAPVQSAVVSKHTCRNSAVWEFFKKCAADPTVANCKLCQMRLKHGKDTRCLGTTCLRRHMTACHTSPEDLRSQITLPQLLQHKKKYSPNHPQAQRLNASLAKLLALQLLPFQLVDSALFCEFAECAGPQWHVPKCHYFSREACMCNVIQSLGKAVSNKVHVTLDTWSSKHGQGRYISFTAHWVTLIAAGRDARRGSVLELFHPPRDRSHTGPEILSALQGQVQRWLTPRQLQLGMIVCDNGSNLLSALRKGKLTHEPCLAHVLNLVVQRFLIKYPGLSELLSQARKVCSHFRWSFPASVLLAEIQREFHLPTNRLICDMPTRWNSTLAMLQRLHKQQRAINEYLCEYGTRTGSGQLDACTVLSPFEEATRMVSRDSEYLSSGVIEGGDSSRECFVSPETPGLVRGWEEVVHDTVILSDHEHSEANATSSLRCMGSLILQSLLKDPKIRAIKERDHYWLAALLDPRYKGKVAELILPSQKEDRMKQLEDALNDDTGACEAAVDQMKSDLDAFPADDPLAYWVLRLDHWAELSQYAMQLLGCPSSSVLSERTFSAVGGFVTDKRVCLSTDSVDRLTFIKMNQSWISSYHSPDADVTE
uniref:BED-type domain-containing protein n=1 Tax=Leptobrachium leishanense TaxID=445787 RepID=A0A8C5M377_9ANUR